MHVGSSRVVLYVSRMSVLTIASEIRGEVVSGLGREAQVLNDFDGHRRKIKAQVLNGGSS